MTLHLLNKARSAHEINEQLSNSIEPGDQVLLIENGVLQCLTQPYPAWHDIASNVYVLSEDASARGLKIPKGFTSVNYDDFVRLSIEHNKVVSWY
jgi:sulfur relay protein TusB/DsrH